MFRYNDPVVFHEYAIDAAQACRERGIKTVAVTAGYVTRKPCEEFYHYMDAANVDLKGFTESFYSNVSGGHLEPVLETLVYLKKSTKVWLEITNLLIPRLNDSEKEIEEMTEWIVSELGPDVPVHFTAFHPDWNMLDREPTPPATLNFARKIAIKNGIHYAYTGNVHDGEGNSTYCPNCGKKLIGRDWYVLTEWNLHDTGLCKFCKMPCPGLFEEKPGTWGPKRIPIHPN